MIITGLFRPERFLPFACDPVLIPPLVYARGQDEQISPGLKQLLRDARFWKNKGDLVRASMFWKRILESVPDEPHALTELGVLSAQNGEIQKAKEYLDRLLKSAPGDPGATRIKNAIQVGKLDPGLLEKAREFRQERQYPKALEYYQKYLKGVEPQGNFALEVLQTETSVPGHFLHAINGLKALLSKRPESIRIRLVLAKSLINREQYRREGLSLLPQLAFSPLQDVSSEARSAWKMGLIWLNPSPDDRKLYENYLQLFPQDMVIRKLLSRIPRSPDRYLGYQMLSAGNLGSAQEHFEKALQSNSRDFRAALGLAIVRMREGRNIEAREILLWASKKNRNNSALKSLLPIASYYSYLEKGTVFMNSGQTSQARVLFQRATRIFPDKSDAYVLRAELNRKEGSFSKAHALDLIAWRLNQNDPRTALNLVSYWVRKGKLQRVRNLLFSKVLRDLAPDKKNKILARIHNLEGKRAQSKGHIQVAIKKYTLALRENHDLPWTLYRLCRIWMREGHVRHALDVYQKYLKSHPDNLSALQAMIYLEAGAGHPSRALSLLRQLPEQGRPPGLVRLSARLTSIWMNRKAWMIAKTGSGELAVKFELLSFLIGNSEKEKEGESNGARLSFARLYALAHEWEKSFPLYLEVLKQSNTSWPVYREALDWSLFAQNDRWSKIFFQMALKRFPRSPGRAMRAGILAEEHGQMEKAYMSYRQALDLEIHRRSPNSDRIVQIRRKLSALQKSLEVRNLRQPFVEFLGGISVLSEGSTFILGEAGELFPVWQSSFGAHLEAPPSVRIWFHVLEEGSFLHYVFAGGQTSINAAGLAIGIRAEFPTGFFDVDLGPQVGELDQTGMAPSFVTGLYGQLELHQDFPFGNLDFFGNYTGILDYLYGQIRLLTPMNALTLWKRPVSLGPEVILQGNSTYNDGQVGGAVQIPLGAGSMSILLDGGLLRSNLYSGWGGYESGFFYVRY